MRKFENPSSPLYFLFFKSLIIEVTLSLLVSVKNMEAKSF